MSHEWGTGNEADYTGLIFSFLCIVVLLFLVSALLSGCATHRWPEIGDGVKVEKITIRECKRGEC